MNKPKMNSFIGVKRIKASEPSTRLEYCDYRGWIVPENEDPNELVRIVEYEQDSDSKANHENHEGYISMSPNNVFEKAYTSAPDSIFKPEGSLKAHEERVLHEANELKSKIDALDSFINKPNDFFFKLDQKEKERLTNQLSAMQVYLSILNQRLASF